MTPTADAIDRFVTGLSDEQFREYLVAALEQRRIAPGVRSVWLRFKHPQNQRHLRAMVFEAFGPKPAPQMPAFDVVPELDL